MLLRGKFLLAALLLCCCTGFVNAQAPYLAGKFVWAEFVTDDLATAQHFYGGLLGWTFKSAKGYTVALNGNQAVAGMFFHPRPADRAAKPRWICYLSASDLARMTQTVQLAGGTIRVPARKIAGLGERVIFADPEGAVFGLIHLQTGDPEDYLADIGSWIWLQLLSRDITSAGSFYQKVGGYSLFRNPQGGRGEQNLLVRDGYSRAAVMQISSQRQKEGTTPLWLPFLHVENVAQSMKQAVALGGRVLVQPSPDLFDGRVILLEDPSGGVVGLMEWDAEDGVEDVAP